MLVFSTHAFTEGDEQKVNIDGISTISTHAFTEGDGPSLTYPFVVMIFQLTPSRKATILVLIYTAYSDYFNSRLHGRRRFT